MSGTAAVEVVDLVKCYGARRALDGRVAYRRARHAARPARPERRRQDHHDRDLRGVPPADDGTVRVLGRSPTDPALRPRVGVMLQDGVGGYREARALELLKLFASYAAHPQDPA